MKRLILAAALAAMTAGAASSASAAPKRHRVRHVPQAATDPAPPLTIQRRSYLDPGDVVPVGSMNMYVWAPAREGNDLYETGGTAWRFGAGALPGQFTAPGRPEPITDF